MRMKTLRFIAPTGEKEGGSLTPAVEVVTLAYDLPRPIPGERGGGTSGRFVKDGTGPKYGSDNRPPTVLYGTYSMPDYVAVKPMAYR